MTDIFIKRKFTQISNKAIEDNNLSMKATYILLYIQSRPTGWKFHRSQIIKLKDGITTRLFAKIMKELESNDYVIRRKYSYGRGKGTQYKWFINDEKFTEKEKDWINNLSNDELINMTNSKYNQNLK